MKRKSGVDIILALGGGHKKPPGANDEEDMKDHGDDEAAEGDLPPDYVTAYEDYKSHPSAQAFWDAVEACVAAGKDSKDNSGY